MRSKEWAQSTWLVSMIRRAWARASFPFTGFTLPALNRSFRLFTVSRCTRSKSGSIWVAKYSMRRSANCALDSSGKLKASLKAKEGVIHFHRGQLQATARKAVHFYYVYILKSKKKPEYFYTGLTEGLDLRLKAHNSGKYHTQQNIVSGV